MAGTVSTTDAGIAPVNDYWVPSSDVDYDVNGPGGTALSAVEISPRCGSSRSS